MKKTKLAIFALTLSLLPGCTPKNITPPQEIPSSKLEKKLELSGPVVDIKTKDGQRYILMEVKGNYYDVYGANTADFENVKIGDSVYVSARDNSNCSHNLFKKPGLQDLKRISTFYIK